MSRLSSMAPVAVCLFRMYITVVAIVTRHEVISDMRSGQHRK